MKVKIGPYPSRLVCNLFTKYVGVKYVNFPSEDDYTTLDKFVDKIDGCIQSIYDATLNKWFLDDREQNIKVKLDPWDTWSMDTTLSHIIVPMLKQLKDDKNGAPIVDLEDVPGHLHPPADFDNSNDSGEVDKNFFKRWDWVVDEMIWAFEQDTIDEGWDMQYSTFSNNPNSELGMNVKTDYDARDEHAKKIANGRRLFAKYYNSLWT